MASITRWIVQPVEVAELEDASSTWRGASALRTCLGRPPGATAWEAAHTVLRSADLYKPIWEYDARVLWRDHKAHLVHGTVTAVIFRLLTGHIQHQS